MRDTTNLYPFTVRVQSGQETAMYERDAATAAQRAEMRLDSPAVLVIRADEPFLRKRSFLGRLADRWL